MTSDRGFLKSGHLPTLAASVLYFDVSFMVWVLLGPLAPFLRDELGLTATEQGLMVAVPLLGGSLFRPLLGTLGDRIGGRRAGLIGLTLTLVPLLLGWKVASSLGAFYAVGFLLGIAGASFAVALPMVSAWYPAKYQGLAMGIAGAGNSGSLVTTLFAPRVAEHYGWQAAFGLMMLPALAVFVFFALAARDSPTRRPVQTWRDYGSVLREPDTLWFSFLYGLTFGGFVGFTSFLTTFFHEQYHVSKIEAGDFTTMVIVSGSLLRPVGGWLADRIGGYRLLLGLLLGVSLCLAVVARLPPLPIVIAGLFVSVGLLGMGNGAVFQLVPQRFPDRMGLLTGIAGAAGGLGGFFLPTLLGGMRDVTGNYGAGLMVLSAVFLGGTLTLLQLGTMWARRWRADATRQAGIFCYRDLVKEILGGETA